MRSGKKLKIAILNPYCWPYVRRGSERFIHDLSVFLAGRGHDVSIISTSPNGASDRRTDGFSLISHKLTGHPVLAKARISPAHIFAFQCIPSLLKGDFDVVHCMTHYDGFAAGACKGLKKYRLVYYIAGIPLRSYFRMIPHDYFMFSCSLRSADRIIVASSFARDSLKRDFGRDAVLLPPPVDTAQFSPKEQRSASPTKIFISGDLNEERKGAKLLARAFVGIKQRVPDAMFQLSGQISPDTRSKILAIIPPDMHNAVDISGIGHLDDLPRLYREAAVTVLPAVWETFGMVLLESLASGTPVVGARHGGIPDIISRDGIGVLFDPGATAGAADNVDGFIKAVLVAFDLSKKEETPILCRAHAEEFGWKLLGPRYERLYYDVLEN